MKTFFKSFLLCTLCSSALIFAEPSPDIEQTGRGRLLSLISGHWVTRSIYTAAELDIAGHLMEGPKKVSELAKLTECHEESLYRLLRMLASVGVFHEHEGRVFSNTAASELLAKAHPESLRTVVLFFKDEITSTWSKLSECIRQGKPAFDLTHGKSFYNYLHERPKSAAHFNAAVRQKSKAVIFSCMRSYNFGKFKSVYDIGGGTGHFLKALLNTYPHMRGVLYELHDVISETKKPIVNFERCSLLAGDFFKTIPKDGDAYILKSVLHDWTDKAALKILENCHQAMDASARLIVIEPFMTSPNQKELAKFWDIYRMASTGGRERTLQDFRSLLEQAGFVIESIIPTDTEFYLIEARKKSS
jgi:hypothetical protein